MTDIEIETPEPSGTGRFTLESISPTMAIAVGVIALCAGVWIGFKLSGGEVTESHVPCRDCAEKAAQFVDTEAEILNSQPVDTE